MEVKNGYNEKVLNINLGKIKRGAELWIEFGCRPQKETLSYITLDELLDLREEINKVIGEIVK